MASMASEPLSTTTISFPRRQWTTRDNRCTLILTAAAQLVWLPSATLPGASSNVFHANTVTAARVAQLVRAGRLWVGAGGRSMRLGVKATLGGKSCLKSGQLEKLRQKVCDWACKLGLISYDREGNSQNSRGDKNDLILSHPPLPDGLYAPHGIPYAQLDRVDCQLRFNFCADGFDLPAPLVKTGQTTKRRRKVRKAKPKANPKPKPVSVKLVKTLPNPDCLFTMSDESWSRTSSLVDAALATLIGIKGRQVGARALDQQSLPSGAPSLLDIAPAAWSHHLFKSTASRATHVPLIYRALSTFTNAQSPRLRRKAEALARLPATADQPSSQESLATRIEEILLKGTLFEPQRLKPVKRERRQERQADPITHLPSPEPTTAPSSQESQKGLAVRGMEAEEEESEGIFYDLDMDSLENAFDMSQGSTEKKSYPEDYREDGESKAGEAVVWDDIEAWTEQPDEWLEDGDADEDEGTFQEFNGSWSLLGYGDEDMDERHDILIAGHEDAGWEDIEDDQLEVALASGDSQQNSQQPWPPWCESEDESGQYMDIDEMGLYEMGTDDEYQADEGVGMWHWQNEHEMIEHIL